MNPAKLQPALVGGVAIGVLSALPIVNLGNACCCAWVVLGGMLAAYMMQQSHPHPISAGDGAVAGLFAGVIGAVVVSILSIPLSLLMGPFQADILEQVIEQSRDLPPEVRSLLERLRTSMSGGAMIGIGFILGLMFSMCLYSVFGLLGGMLGAVVFRKNTPPPPPPPPSGFEPPTFVPAGFPGPPPPPPPPPSGP